MGDPKKPRRKYSTPSHPWQKQRIDEEKPLLIEYGLTNKKEIWRVTSLLRRYKKIAKQSIIGTSAQAAKQRQDLMRILQGLGLASETGQLDDVLSLTPKHLFERRLQTLVFKKAMANSIKQSRQFITHGHIAIAGKRVTVPGYLVKKSEEATIGFDGSSLLASPEHAERNKHGKKG